MQGRRRTLGIALALCAIVAVVAFGLTSRKGHVPVETPRYDRAQLVSDLGSAGHALGDAVHIRIFKRERLLEVWLSHAGGRFEKFRAYPICAMSGEIGPKLAEGDRQAPEGFYRVGLKQLNPASRRHLAFNLGFPNAFDRSLGRTGSALMVHGGCSSIGCYAITDAAVDQVYAMVETALKSGQPAVDVHAFPFRLEGHALVEMSHHPASGFWKNLKTGYDLFETDGRPPAVATCGGQYRFAADAEGPECTAIAAWS